MLTSYHLLWTARVETPLELADYPGPELRGALFDAIWRRSCVNKQAESCLVCPLVQLCPVSALLAPVQPRGEDGPGGVGERISWGRDLPRPYILLPPLGVRRRYEPGELLRFGLTLFGSIIELLPYIIVSIPEFERQGLGRRLSENGGRRGTFHVERVEAYHPYNGERQLLYSREQVCAQMPSLSVEADDVRRRATSIPEDRLTLAFLTPLRLVENRSLKHQADFQVLVWRLLERLTRLALHYGERQEAERLWSEREHWLTLAQSIRCEEDATRWQDVASYSQRLKRATPIGGLLGHATFVGNLAPFRELLLWGELVHVGKDTVKGNGWYRIVQAGAPEALLHL
ncbi:CRISPR system precrRNA processing endoribonuclease RAMP protein Cas6 [Thermogemmatispora sp.]|jgi:hypothetical protein|uniref:CRISPR system precrRNA processing endoribonuclease RAMP protein Cas6 n=1 Tax=Thermogemmatispora sp. TaxID=1968838 RepID=UPI0035E45F7E